MDTTAHLTILAAAKPHGGGATLSGAATCIILLLIIYALHLRGNHHLHRLMLVVLGAFLIEVHGQVGDWLRTIVSSIEQVFYYVAQWF